MQYKSAASFSFPSTPTPKHSLKRLETFGPEKKGKAISAFSFFLFFFLPNHAEDAGSCKDSIIHNAKNNLKK